jgi:hypothetical protein
MQPAPQSVDRRCFASEALRKLAELIDFTPIHSLEQGLARREMTIERPYADAGPLRHSFEAGVGAAGAEDVGRRIEQALPIANRIRARLAHEICCPI